jgi:hypothetical protein
MTHSLRGRLLIGLTLMIVSTGIGAGAVGFQWAFDEAIEMQDAILTQVGALALNTRFQNDASTNSGVDAEARVTIEELGDRPSGVSDARSGSFETVCMSSPAIRSHGGSWCGHGRTAAGLPSANLPRYATRSRATAPFIRFCHSQPWRRA